MSSLQLSSRRVTLVDVADVGVPVLHRLVNQQANAFRFRSLGPGTPIPMLERAIRDGVLCQFGIARADRPGEVLGLVQAIVADFKHGTAQMAIVLDEAVHGRGWPLEGLALFLNHLYCSYPLRKVYVQILGPHIAFIGAKGLATMFREEGVLTSHEWLMGEYVDAHFFSISREEFYGNRTFLALVGSQP